MIKSMTGFARVSEEGDFGAFTWEIRRVNSRFLEINPKFPDYLVAIEGKCRRLLGEQLKRGKVDLKLYFQLPATCQWETIVDLPLVKGLLSAEEKVMQEVGESGAPLSARDFLKWPGVVSFAPPTLSDQIESTLLKGLLVAIEKLDTMGQAEGERLKATFITRLAEMKTLSLAIEKLVPEMVAAQRERLQSKCASLAVTVDPERLEWEIVAYAQKIDVAEECDRFQSHLKGMHDILNQPGPHGRAMDFLLQEMNREANTMASKSSSPDITKNALQLKCLIEQCREQVQNIE